jgi:hypothetical protein
MITLIVGVMVVFMGFIGVFLYGAMRGADKEKAEQNETTLTEIKKSNDITAKHSRDSIDKIKKRLSKYIRD